MNEIVLKRLPLESLHKEINAKMIPFAGWNMPVQYTGISDEHNAVRSSVGIFDVSHMGQLKVSGEGTEDFLNLVSTNNIRKMSIGRAQYGLVLNHQGGVIDDIINYKQGENDFFVCANASNVEEVYSWFLEQAKAKDFNNIKIENLSSLYAQIALQGPRSMAVIEEYFGAMALGLKRFSFFVDPSLSNNNLDCIVARTGYSGEDGCEIFLPIENGEKVWRGLFLAGEKIGTPLKPCGLGARDTLRLEACLPLHGHEIRSDITPLSAKLDRFLDFEKEFIGRSALEQQKKLGVSPVLVGLKVEGSGIIRADYPVVSNDRTVGWVTSGTMTPTIGSAIGLALVMPDYVETGKSLEVKVRDKLLKVVVVETPFYKRS